MEEPRGRPGYARGGIVLVVAMCAMQSGRLCDWFSVLCT